jgi:hypothetical protein
MDAPVETFETEEKKAGFSKLQIVISYIKNGL